MPNPQPFLNAAAISPPFSHIPSSSLHCRIFASGSLPPRHGRLPSRDVPKNPPRVRMRSSNWSPIDFFLTMRCPNGDWRKGKTSPHPILMRLWCFLPSSPADLDFPPVNLFLVSFIITKSSLCKLILTPSFKSPSLCIYAKLSLSFLPASPCSKLLLL
jgi:hypothetical protein